MDTFALIAAERRRLADALDSLTDDEWARPSLCAGWTNHTVVAHLNLPWSTKRRDLAVGLLRARGNIDAAMDAASRQLQSALTPPEAIDRLRSHAEDRFRPPMMPAEAPLTDAIVHGADILHPLGRSVAVAPEALTAMLHFLVDGKARRGFVSATIADVRLEATDTGWTWGTADTGAANVVRGPALALAGRLVGRPIYDAQLSGAGLARLG
jgi:uncharacterized protein (TIGR03083 family)